MKAGSCNGCRILRKGCKEDCIIRPCIEWIDCPESQANATLFLAKYYGRAGLVNLISAGYESQRISLFKSLLYEACGRILNPVYGSLGLLYSGNWYQCEEAVRSVLRGSFTATGIKDATSSMELSIAGCDIRHSLKNESILPSPKISCGTKTRTRSKRPISDVDRRDCFSEQGKVGDFLRNLGRTEKKSKETVELALRLPSMADLASPMNQKNGSSCEYNLPLTIFHRVLNSNLVSYGLQLQSFANSGWVFFFENQQVVRSLLDRLYSNLVYALASIRSLSPEYEKDDDWCSKWESKFDRPFNGCFLVS